MGFDFDNGEILLIDKPYTWTSFDVVKKLRGTLKIKKIGHAGTLDPLATGLLILCTGKMTKKIEQFQGMEKEYRGEMVLGKTTPSIDLETEFDSAKDISHITEKDITDLAQKFTGSMEQIPPRFSAVKVDGERVYKKAREGKPVSIKPRLVMIREFTITEISLPRISFNVVCSKGTYIRSLVRDFGQGLGTGAYLSALCRTRIGPYTLAQASKPDSFIATVKQSRT